MVLDDRPLDGERVDVAIVGGSTTGLALALAFARCLGPSLAVGLIDRGSLSGDAPTEADPRAVAIAASSRRLLDALGVWARVADVAQPVRRIEITDSGLDAGIRPVLLAWDNHIGGGVGETPADGSSTAAHIVPLAALNAALLNAIAAETSIRRLASSDVTGVTADSFGAEVALNGREPLTARLVVAADGQRSPLREAAGIKVVGWPYEQIGITTTVAHEREHDGVAVQHFLPSGPFAILPLTGRRSCITWTESADVGRALMALDGAAFLDEVDRRFGGKLGALTLEGPRRAWPLSVHLARSYVGNRLALVGDAAHAVHPIAGQGLNLAFRDVAALVEVVADAARAGLDIGDGLALGRYERWRRFDAMAAAAAFDAINRVFSRENLLLRSAREVGLQVVDRLPGLKRALVGEAAGTSGDLPKLLRGQLA